MTRIPALPIRTRNEAGDDDEQIPDELDLGEWQLPDRTIPRDDGTVDHASENSEAQLEGIDPYWTDASNLKSLESFVTDLDNVWKTPDPAQQSKRIELRPENQKTATDDPEQSDTGSRPTPARRDGVTNGDAEPQQIDEQPPQTRSSERKTNATNDLLIGNETVNQLELRLSNEFTPIKEINWDTVIYIGPPPRQHNQSPEEYEFITRHFSRPYLMRSQTLRDSGSAEFADRLGPKSARAMRKLKNLGLHQNLPSDGQAKYWIDLRPMQNDDEAAQTLSELTCTPGILSWHIIGAKKSIDPMLIKGKDKMNIPWEVSSGVNLPANFFSANATAMKGDSVSAALQSQTDDDLEPDYSPLRHYSAIERLLQALAGRTPKLNSAPKMWAFFAVARILDCARHPRVCDEIYSWLFNGFNSEFIEANPEVCYRIAMGIQNKMLLRVTFSILVGEKAALQVQQQFASASATSPTAVRSRPLCHLDDDEVNRIDHAARSLSRRIWGQFNEMTDFPMTWMAKSIEVFKLLALSADDPIKQEQIKSIWLSLRHYVRSEIVHGLLKNVKNPPDSKLTANGATAHSFSDETVAQYNRLRLPQRLFSQVSWRFIKSNSIFPEGTLFMTLGSKQWDGLEDIYANIGPVSLQQKNRGTVETDISAINTQLTLGYIRYNGIVAQEMKHGAYEVRWDAVYSAARRNLSMVSEIFSKAECDKLLQVISEREGQHQREVRWFDSRSATQGKSGNTGGNPGVSPSSRYAESADYYYTGAHVSTSSLWSQLANALNTKIESSIVRPGYLKDACDIEADIRVDSIDTLLCLDEDEFKFLPLWADGCDDGTGGVYTEAVPGAIDEDFQGGKRGLDADEGLDDLDDIEMGESFSVIDTVEAESTVFGASHAATAGLGTDSVMSLDE